MAQNEFSLAGPQGEFNAFTTERNAKRSAQVDMTVAALNTARTGQPFVAVVDEIAAVGPLFQEAAARQEAVQGVNNTFSQQANVAVEDASLGSLQAAEQERLKDTEIALNSKAPEALAQSAYDVVRTRAASRLVGTMKVLDEVMNEATATTLTILVDIVDMVVSGVPDAITGGGFSRAQAAKDLTALRSADITDEEYYSELRTQLQRANDAGFLQNENFLFLAGFTQNVREGGQGPEAALDMFATGVELALAPSTVLASLNVLRTTTRAVSKLKGSAAATRHLKEAHELVDTEVAVAAGIPEHTSTAVNRHPLPVGGEFSYVAQGADVAEAAASSNRFLKSVGNLPFFRDIDPRLVDEWLPIGTERLTESVVGKERRSLLDVATHQDDSGNVFGTMYFGSQKGVPFAKKNAAERLATKLGPDARVMEPEIIGGRETWRVSQTKNMSTGDLIAPLEADEIGRSFLSAFASTLMAVPKRLDALAKGGEATLTTAANKIGNTVRQSLKGVSKEEIENVENVFYELRDGQRLSYRRTALNEEEFKTEWAVHSSTPPSKKAVALYNTIQELNDAVYFWQADRIFKRVVDEGTEVMQFSVARKNGDLDDWSILVNKVDKDDIDAALPAINPETGVEMDIGALARTQSVYRVEGGYEAGGTTYRYAFTDKPKIRRVYHSDVLGYNPGGSRSYKAGNYFLKQDTTVNVAGEGVQTGRPRTFMLTATRNEARQAADEVNNIFKTFRATIPGLENLSQANAVNAIRQLAGNVDVADVIRANTAWNRNVDDVDSMLDFVLGQKLDPRKDVGFAVEGEALQTIDIDGKAVFGGRIGETYDEQYTRQINRPRNSTSAPRKDEPLIGFGGDAAETLKPINMMQQDLTRAMHHKAFAAYNTQAVKGWLNGAERFMTADSKKLMTGKNAMADMKIADFGKAPDKEARRYIQARDAIIRTIGAKSEAQVKWDSLIDRVSEFVYNTGAPGGKRVSEIIRDPNLARTPFEYLRAMAFDVRLGMFDPGQYIVQSSQFMNILAISPTKALGAAASHVPLRLAMHAGDNPKVWAEIGRRAAPFIGMSADEFVEFADFTFKLGRMNVGTEVAELSGTSFELTQGMWKRARGLSRVFFNEGEKMPRAAALNVAWREFKEKFPGGVPTSESGKRWIISRQDALTAGMTAKSAAAWQRGIASVPLQFMTYSSRMLESIFTDRLLSGRERAQLATAQVVFWGAAGVGGGTLLDAYMTDNGYVIDTPSYTLWRTGALDAMLQWSTGTKAQFGGRIAMAEGFGDLLKNAWNGEFIEIIGGPSGQFVTDVSQDLITGFGDLANGRSSLLVDDVKKLVRNVTGPNKLYTAWVIYSLGDYVSRSDDTTTSGLTKLDGVLALAGAQIADVNNTYSRIEVFKNQDDRLRDHTDTIKRFMKVMDSKLENNDPEGAREVQKQIQLFVAILPAWQQTKVLRGFQPQLESLYDKTMREYVFRRGGAALERGQNDNRVEGE